MAIPEETALTAGNLSSSSLTLTHSLVHGTQCCMNVTVEQKGKEG